MAQWYVHTHSGQRYGPIEREELDRWVEDGRLTPACQVWTDGWPEWRQAPEIFPQLLEKRQGGASSPGDILGASQPGSSAQQNPGQQTQGMPGSPFATGSQPAAGNYGGGYYGGGGPMLPDRSTTVFVLGLLGILVCGVLCIPAWIMGSADLKEIDAGRRDPAGRGMTQAGMIMGIIGSVLMLIGVVFLCLYFAMVGAIIAPFA